MTTQGATLVVLYPRTPTSTFNLAYYTTNHMALVTKLWTSLGLKSYSVTQYTDDAPYTYGAVLEWESSEHIAKAVADPVTQEVLGDVGNFSSEKPVLVSGGVVARGGGA